MLLGIKNITFQRSKEVAMQILNDTEHRIFLSAIQREKKICEELDELPDNGTKLLPVCRSIERKVNDAIPKDVLSDIINEIESLPTTYAEIQRPNSVVCRDTVELLPVLRILRKYL